MNKINNTLALALVFALVLAFSIASGWCDIFPSKTIHLVAMSFNTNDDYLKEIPNDFRLDGYSKEEVGLYIIQFSDTPLKPWKDKVEALGVKLNEYIPDNAYLVRMDKATTKAIARIPEVRWIGIFQPYFKVNTDLWELMESKQQLKLLIKVYKDVELDDLAARIKEIAGSEAQTWQSRYFDLVGVTISGDDKRERLSAISRLSEVSWIERFPKYELCNNNTYWICQSGIAGGGATPIYDQGIHGEGEIVAVLDTGCDADMCYFYDGSEGMPGEIPNYDQRKIVAYHDRNSRNDWDGVGHGTHTAGTVAGDNFANPIQHDSGDGIAPGAKLIIEDYGIPGDLSIPPSMYTAYNNVYQEGARLHSNSWGDPRSGGQYLVMCQETDQFHWDYPDFLAIFAAGNEGPGSSSLRSPGASKDVVCVGATEGGSSANDMASFSSHGPTPDGRLKPDVTMPGSSIMSAANDGSPSTFNCSETSMSGTSMATPGVAGAAALVRQYFADGFYPLGWAEPGNAFNPSGALVKACLINSGVNMTGSYTDGSIPSNGQGWGRVLLDDVLYFQDDTRDLYIDDNLDGISTGEEIVYNVAIISTEQKLEVSLVWNDYPGTPSAKTKLVNNLDLEVIHGMTSYKGNNYSGGQSVPGGSFENANNVECVQINNPTVGLYTIKVKGAAVPQGPQPFALVVTGDIGFQAGIINMDRSKYNCSDTIEVTLSDYDLKGVGTYDLDIMSDSEPSGQKVTLSEVAPDSGVLKGTIEVTDTPPHDNKLLVAEGDTIEVIYIDEDDGMGGHNIEKIDQAICDCTAPQVLATDLGDRTDTWCEIIIETNEPTTIEIHYGTKPGELPQTANDNTLTPEHAFTVEDLQGDTMYYYEIVATDEAGNILIDDNEGNYYLFKTLKLLVCFYDNMNFDKGWREEGDGQWERAVPQGLGGGGIFGGEPDPNEDHTGDGGKVWGTDLTQDGNYNSPTDCTLISPFINCSQSVGTQLRYYQWVNTTGGLFGGDAVTSLKVSNDGFNWIELWNSSGETMQEWKEMAYDISEVADGRFAVRFKLRLTYDGGIFPSPDSGWNIDDWYVYGYKAESWPPETPTPVNTPTMTPTATQPGPSPTPTATPTNTNPGDPTHTPTFTDTPTANPSHSPTPTPDRPNKPTMNEEPPCTAGYMNRVSWSDESASGAEYYLCECALENTFSEVVATSDWINSTGYEFSGLEHGKTYYYRVRAKNSVGAMSGWSNPVSSKQDAIAPSIMLFGYWSTRLHSAGGQLIMAAYCPDDDINELEVLYQDMPTGLKLYDNGQNGDIAPGDNLYMMVMNIEGTFSPISALLTLLAEDCAHNQGVSPQLRVSE